MAHLGPGGRTETQPCKGRLYYITHIRLYPFVPVRLYRAVERRCLRLRKNGPQTVVIINVECEAAHAHRFDDPAEECLDRVMDYTQAHRFIATEVAHMGHIPLLEPIAEMIIAFCFRDPRVAKVRVRLEKPAVLPDVTVGIEIFRVRSSA